MTEHGTLKHTLKYRGNPNFEVVGEGVMLDERGQYVPNNVPISVSKYYADYWRRANVETNSFDASFLKLREARIEYTIPSAGLNKIGIERLTLALYGRNLAMWTKDFPVYDPEVATLNNGTNTIPFQARYYAIGEATPGAANADATFKVQYQ